LKSSEEHVHEDRPAFWCVPFDDQLVKAPLPQPTSTHHKPGRGAIQSRKILPASLLQAPIILIGSPVVEADLMLRHWSF